MNFISANVELLFASHLTLTYRAREKSWETSEDRNRRIIEQCREDRHRFLRCLRKEIGEFLWVREFQTRGVVHFHVVTAKPVGQERVAQVWSRASGQLHDDYVRRHGVKVDPISSQGGVRRCVGRYIGKGKQKTLPKGIDGAGCWWGRSRGLNLALLDEIIWLDPSEGYRKPSQPRIVRVCEVEAKGRLGWRPRRRLFGGLEGRLAARQSMFHLCSS